MNWNQIKRGVLRLSLISGTGLYITMSAPSAVAQSTPTELADMSLEELLNVQLPTYGDDIREDKWTFHYSYRKARFGGYRRGTQDLSFDEVLFTPGEPRTAQNYPVVPTYITQRVHAFSAQYAVSDRTSLRVTVPYLRQSTEHTSSISGFSDFELWSKGFGDVALSITQQFAKSPTSQLSLSAGLQLPVGTINQTGDTPRMGPGTLERLPYTMQLGSGTLDLTASVQYSVQKNNFVFASNNNVVIRTGRNDNNYRLGNSFSSALTGLYTQEKRFQPGVKLSYRTIDTITGEDETLKVPRRFPYPASITDGQNYGGEIVTTSAVLRSCVTKDCRLSLDVDYTVPLYQSLNGIQPKLRKSVSVGANVAF